MIRFEFCKFTLRTFSFPKALKRESLLASLPVPVELWSLEIAVVKFQVVGACWWNPSHTPATV